MNKRVSLEKKLQGEKENMKLQVKKKENMNLPPKKYKKKRREKESKRKWGRKLERVRVKCCKENELKSLVG